MAKEEADLCKITVTWDRSGRIDDLHWTSEYIVKKSEIPTFYGNLHNKNNNFLEFTTHSGVKICIQKARIRDMFIETACARSANGEV